MNHTNSFDQNKKPKIGILTEDSAFSACFNIRVKYPLDCLSKLVEVTYIARMTADRKKEIHPEKIKECDIFLVQRSFPSLETQSLINQIIDTKKPIIYESDDLLDEIPTSNAEYSYYSQRSTFIKDFIKKADLLLLSTPELQRHYLQPDFPPAHCFQNHLPLSIWNDLTPQRPDHEFETIKIGFAGTIARARDIALIEEPLLRIARVYEDRVKIIIWGFEASENLRTLENLINIKSSTPYPLYPKKLASLGLDIGLAPLEDNSFNRCKSDLKWLEFASLGIPAIVSDIAPYAEARDNNLALCVPNDPDAWFEALVQLIENKALRTSLGQRARSYVQQNRSLEQNIKKYAEILNHVLPDSAKIPTNHPIQITPIRNLHPDEIAINADIYIDWTERTSIQETDAEVLAERMLAWPNRPAVTLFTVATQPYLPIIAETLHSLQDQLYENWHFWVISDQPCPDPIFDQADFLAWIQVDTLDDTQGLADFLNQLLAQSGGDLFAWLPAGTRLQAQALLVVIDHFFAAGQVSAVYTDHDYYGREGQLRPQFKPDFDLEWLRSYDYIGQAVFFRTADLLALGGLQPYPDAMLYDLLLRIAEHPEAIVSHHAYPLLSFPLTNSVDDPAPTIARQVAVEKHLARCGKALKIQSGAIDGSFRLEPAVERLPRASIIVAAKDVFHRLEACLESLFDYTDYPDYEVVVVDNASSDPDVHRLYTMLEQAGRPLRVLHGHSSYEPLPSLNRGAAAATGEVLVFISPDCVFCDRNWLKRLVSQALRDEVGVVGPLVLQPEFGQVESAGLFLGGNQSPFATARPALRGLQIDDNGYMGMLRTPRTTSAVSLVGFTVRREYFQALGGFDERFSTGQFEIDFCLRANERGWKTIYTPYSRIVLHRDSSLSYLLDSEEARLTHVRKVEAEQALLLKQWGSQIGHDPHASPHFSMSESGLKLEDDFPLAWPTAHHQRARVLGFPVSGGSGEYRVKMPFKGLTEAGWLYAETARPMQARLPSIAEMLRLQPDSVLLHQKIGPLVNSTLDNWKKVLPNLKIVFGLDDRMDAIPFKSNLYMMHKRGNPDARSKLRKIIERSDTVIVSTDPLAELVYELAGETDVRIIPNSLVRNTWAHLQPKRRPEGKPRVGWVGAHQHRGDLELIIPVLEATHKQVDWVFMGMWLPEFQGLVKEKHPSVSFEDYPATIATLDLDLAIAPLEINPFNEAKSNLRLLEYGILGYPVICTDIYPYQTMDAPVLRLPNQPKRWIEAILDKVADRDALQREGAVLREWVMRHFLLEQHLPAWNDALLKS